MTEQTIPLSEGSETQTVLDVRWEGSAVWATIQRPDARNALNRELRRQFHTLLDQLETHPTCKALVILGQGDVFCTGMDLEEAEATEQPTPVHEEMLYKRLASLPCTVIAVVEGEAAGGGVGLAAACDIVIANSKARFSLPEALWGLVPVTVLPYLVRRIGFQKTYDMTLTTRTVIAAEAHQFHLIDILHESPRKACELLIRRVSRVSKQTVQEVKAYFRGLGVLDDAIEQNAMEQHLDYFSRKDVRERFRRFREEGKRPWEQ